MPATCADGQPNQFKDVLGGNAHQQIDALFNCLLQGERIKRPAQGAPFFPLGFVDSLCP